MVDQYQSKLYKKPGEEAISKSAEYSFRYALNVVKGRWEPGEEAISKDRDLIFRYATDVIGGRLPEWMEEILLGVAQTV